MMKIASVILALALSALAMSCATRLPDAEAERRTEEVFDKAFAASGRPDMLARLKQDEVQRLCTRYHNQPPREIAEQIEKSQTATIRYPASGKLMGDWRQGERIAQDGYGLRFTDRSPKRPNGGNCYACHQLAPRELSYGTLGPSLYRFGKTRGAGESMQRYVYAKVYNAQAFSACSNMPRLGYHEVLTPEQIAHLVALLLDPNSPVNQ